MRGALVTSCWPAMDTRSRYSATSYGTDGAAAGSAIDGSASARESSRSLEIRPLVGEKHELLVKSDAPRRSAQSWVLSALIYVHVLPLLASFYSTIFYFNGSDTFFAWTLVIVYLLATVANIIINVWLCYAYRRDAAGGSTVMVGTSMTKPATAVSRGGVYTLVSADMLEVFVTWGGYVAFNVAYFDIEASDIVTSAAASMSILQTLSQLCLVMCVDLTPRLGRAERLHMYVMCLYNLLVALGDYWWALQHKLPAYTHSDSAHSFTAVLFTALWAAAIRYRYLSAKRLGQKGLREHVCTMHYQPLLVTAHLGAWQGSVHGQ